MKTRNIILILLVVALVGWLMWVGTTQNIQEAPTAPDQAAGTETIVKTNQTTPTPMTTATITTSKGVITVELYGSDAPKTVENFKKLAESAFYDGTRFHRVIKGFMIQGGDPLSKDTSKQSLWGTGGPGYKFADEINASSPLYQTGYKRGVLAMANSGPNTNGSQFFIMHQDYALPPLYAIFGKVTAGQDVVDAIANTPTGPNDRPVTDVVIEKVEIK
jgi:cyclophilin family peptidyl-prolyl cis-trans isomerase